MMAQMWQYYDRAIGQAIKDSVEPIMDQYKPPGLVKRIYFKRITFGDLPITIDDVWIENEGEKHVLLEVSQLQSSLRSACRCRSGNGLGKWETRRPHAAVKRPACTGLSHTILF